MPARKNYSPVNVVIFGCTAVLLILLAWPHLFFYGQVPIDGNVLRLNYPNWSYLLSHPVLPWKWPLWNPYRNMGEPFLADPASMAAYPPLWLLCRLRTMLSLFRWWVVAHSLLAGYFMGRWVYLHTRDEEASFAAALVMMFNGFFMSRLTLVNHFAAASYFPMVFYYFDTERVLPFAVALALQWLAGFPSFCYITALSLVGWSVFSKSSKWILLGRGGFLAFGLAAFQVLPFLELLAHSARGIFLTPSHVIEYSESLRQLFKMVCVPQWFLWHPQLSGDQAVVSFYAGPVSVAAMGWALWKGKRNERLLLTAIFVSLCLSLGGHLPGYAHIALLRVFRYPANWLVISATAMAFLCGVSLARLKQKRWKRIVIIFLAMDLVSFARYTRVPWFTPDYLSDPPPLVSALRSLPPSRIYHSPLYSENLAAHPLSQQANFLSFKDFLPPSYGMAFGVREVSSYQVLTLARANQFQNRLAAEGPLSPLLRWAGVSTIVTSEHAAGTQGPEISVVLTLRDFKPPLFIAEEGVANKIVPKTYEPGNVRAVVFVEKPATLVFSEVSYPGWRAFLDNGAIPESLFENTFQSVSVPPGAHWVQFMYRPASFLVGMTLTGGVLAAIFWFYLRKRFI